MTRPLLLGAALAALSASASLAGGLAPAIVEPMVLGASATPDCPAIPAAAASLRARGVAIDSIAVSGGVATFATSAGPLSFACAPALAAAGLDADGDGLPDGEELAGGGVAPAVPGQPIGAQPIGSQPIGSQPIGGQPVALTPPEDGSGRGPQGNNGCGNGNQSSPGNSSDNNNAENAGGDTSPSGNGGGGNCPDPVRDRSID